MAGVKAHRRDDHAKRHNIILDETMSGWIGIGGIIYDCVLSPDEARTLARQLNRLARRVEERKTNVRPN